MAESSPPPPPSAPGLPPPWWEPPLAGTDVEHLLGSLERMRATFRWKADGLDAAGLSARVGASTLTLGQLLKHLASVEEEISTWRLRGERPGPPFAMEGGHDASFATAGDDPPEALYAWYDEAVERSRERFAAALGDGGLDQVVHLTGLEGEQVTLRRLLSDLVEEYGRHTGHADLLREAVDGRVGEDPPWDWDPRTARTG